ERFGVEKNSTWHAWAALRTSVQVVRSRPLLRSSTRRRSGSTEGGINPGSGRSAASARYSPIPALLAIRVPRGVPGRLAVRRDHSRSCRQRTLPDGAVLPGLGDHDLPKPPDPRRLRVVLLVV